jgi:hypothetical protein
MAIPQKDIKVLWGRAASRCAICQTNLSHVNQEQNSAIPIGEQAHIVAEEVGGPRGNSALTATERNSYYNLILLCPTHHTLIDKDIESYPIEKLHLIKSKHELWVEETLGRKMVTDGVVFELAEFMAFIELIRPLILWLHSPVPAQQAKEFFEALQTFWLSRNISTHHLDRKLTRGVESLLRPLASDELPFSNNNHYSQSKLSIGYSLLSEYFSSKKVSMAGVDRHDSVRDIIYQLTVELENAFNDPIHLNSDDQNIIRHILHITKYYDAFFRNNKYIQVPEIFVRNTLQMFQDFLSEEFRVIYPDELDDRSLDIIQRACKGSLFKGGL